MDQIERAGRILDALENIAAEMERLRLLKEYELGAHIEHGEGGPYVKVDEGNAATDWARPGRGLKSSRTHAQRLRPLSCSTSSKPSSTA